jgi:hypothetical protein
MTPVEGVEQLAERFLEGVPSYLWDGQSLPVPIEDIADSHLGLLVRDVDDLSRAPGAPALAEGQALSGLLLPDRGEIWVSATEAREWPARRRFTIAHELGHWCLHRHDARGLYCRRSAIEPDAQIEQLPLPAPEQQANVFAASVLMPSVLIREQYVASDRDFDQLCRSFASSRASMGRRLRAVI